MKMWGRSLGLGAGFWASKADFETPKPWPTRLLYAALGLAVAIVHYLASSALLPNGFKRSSSRGLRALRRSNAADRGGGSPAVQDAGAAPFLTGVGASVGFLS